jgi:hypothetical protein
MIATNDDDTLDRDTVEATPSKPPADGPPDRSDEDILKELRERRSYAGRAWADIRAEGAKDVMCVAGDVWEAMAPEGLKQRQSAARPSIAPDEIGQYLNQTGNDVRQNKRSIRATPIGNGADKQTAEFIQGRTRQIEYRSNAQREVYAPIFEDALQRSYGFGRFVAKRASDLSRNLELLIEAFPNPDVVLPDPDGAMLSPDCAKIEWAFILDASRTRKMFKREFGDTADVVDFTDDHVATFPDWFRGEHVTLAEYWTIDRVPRRVVFLKSNPARGYFEKDIPVAVPETAIDYEHWVDVPYVCQYLTNGVELLAKKGRPKRTPWPGKSIPIFSCFGKALYVQGANGGTQRRLLSMVRPMRPSVMYYAYIRSCEAEVVGGVPRTNYIGYEGQFRGHEEAWTKMAHEPVPYVEARPTTEATGGQILPLPERQSWDPPLQNLDMLAESARRMIQAAAGTSPLPTEAQRVNQKSGKALDRIEASGQKGSYHFVDHLDGMITRVGQMAAELIPHYDDTMGEVTVRNFKDEPIQQRINDPNDPKSVMVSPDYLHDITISVGPYEADEREASSDFADSIVANTPLMQMVGPKAPELIAAAIRLKAVGPIGDEMAEIISPKPPEPGQPPTPQQLQQAQAQMEGLQQENQGLKQAIETDQAKQAGAVEAARLKAEADAVTAAAEVEMKWRIAQLEAETELEKVRLQEATKLQLAEYELRKVEIQAEIDARQAALGVVQQRETLAADADEAERSRAHESDEARASREAAADEAERSRAAEAQAAEAGA